MVMSMNSEHGCWPHMSCRLRPVDSPQMLLAYAAGEIPTQQLVFLHHMPCRFASVCFSLLFEVKAVTPTVYHPGPLRPACLQR